MKIKTEFQHVDPDPHPFRGGRTEKPAQAADARKKALLAISNGKSTRANGYLAATEEQLRLAGIESVVFDRIEANPLKSTVMAGAAAAREHGCDMIVALGGGSVMDAAKAIALMATTTATCGTTFSAGRAKNSRPDTHRCRSSP